MDDDEEGNPGMMGTMAPVVNLKYFAAAADAAGRDEETMSFEPGATVADLQAELGERHGAQLAGVLELCSFLLDGEVADPAQVLPGGEVRIDVLPPFAGG